MHGAVGTPGDVNTCRYLAVVARKLSPLDLCGQCLFTLRRPASVFAHVCVVTADCTLAAPGVTESDIPCGWILSSDRISSCGQWQRTVEAGTRITERAHSTVSPASPLGGGGGVGGGRGVGRCRNCAGETSFAALQQDGVEAQSEMQRGESAKSTLWCAAVALAWL